MKTKIRNEVQVLTLQDFSSADYQYFRKQVFALFNRKKKSIFRSIDQYFMKFLIRKYLKFSESLNAYEVVKGMTWIMIPIKAKRSED